MRNQSDNAARNLSHYMANSMTSTRIFLTPLAIFILLSMFANAALGTPVNFTLSCSYCSAVTEAQENDPSWLNWCSTVLQGTQCEAGGLGDTATTTRKDDSELPFQIVETTSEVCTDCRCSMLPPSACESNTHCFLRVNQSCATLVGYGVAVEKEFEVPWPPLDDNTGQTPYITQGGKTLELDTDFSSKKSGSHSTTITLKDSAADKVKEPGGYIEWSAMQPGSCILDPKYDSPPMKDNTGCDVSFHRCEANKYCKWAYENNVCIELETEIPEHFCSNSLTKRDCKSRDRCTWVDDDVSDSLGTNEERLDLCKHYSRTPADGCTSDFYENLLSVSHPNGSRGGDWSILLGPKKGRLGESVLFGARVSNKVDTTVFPGPGFEPSWVRIDVGGAFVTKVEVTLKAAQTEIPCNKTFAATRSACQAYGYTDFLSVSTKEDTSTKGSIQAVLLTESQQAYLRNGTDETFRSNFYYQVFASHEGHLGTECTVNMAQKMNNLESINNFDRYTTAPIDSVNLKHCQDKVDGCDRIILNFQKYRPSESESCSWKFRNWYEYLANSDNKVKWVLLWFPYGYMQIYDIDIYHIPDPWEGYSETRSFIEHSFKVLNELNLDWGH